MNSRTGTIAWIDRELRPAEDARRRLIRHRRLRDVRQRARALHQRIEEEHAAPAALDRLSRQCLRPLEEQIVRRPDVVALVEATLRELDGDVRIGAGCPERSEQPPILCHRLDGRA